MIQPKTDASEVNVVMATYNYGHCIAGAIVSVLAQASQDVELVIIDGGSTDGTTDIVKPCLAVS